MGDRGRPTLYTEKLVDLICSRVSEGESLKRLSEDPEMPGRNTLHQWLLKYEYFRDKYAQAREIDSDNVFDELLNIADMASCDNMVALHKEKLRIDTRKWVLSKRLPKKYGDKQEDNSTDVNIRFIKDPGPTDEEI